MARTVTNDWHCTPAQSDSEREIAPRDNRSGHQWLADGLTILTVLRRSHINSVVMEIAISGEIPAALGCPERYRTNSGQGYFARPDCLRLSRRNGGGCLSDTKDWEWPESLPVDPGPVGIGSGMG